MGCLILGLHSEIGKQITNAKSIIEIGIDKLNPDPSFGSHFFQNLTSLMISYFTLGYRDYKKNID